MRVKGKGSIRIKIILENKLNQISNFIYLGCYICYHYDNDMKNKLYKSQYLYGTKESLKYNKRYKNDLEKQWHYNFSK